MKKLLLLASILWLIVLGITYGPALGSADSNIRPFSRSSSGGTDTNWIYSALGKIYPATTTNQVLIGKTSTSTNAMLEVEGDTLASGTSTADRFIASGDGTLSDPAYTFTSNPDTGLRYNTASNKLSFVYDGTEIAHLSALNFVVDEGFQASYVDANGPLATSTFYGGVDIMGYLRLRSTDADNGLLRVYSPGIINTGLADLTTDVSGILPMVNGGTGTSTGAIQVTSVTATSTTGNSTFAGNVGIGTTTPYAKLSVAGQVVAQNYVATSTTATSTLPKLNGTVLDYTNMCIGGDCKSAWPSVAGVAWGSITGTLSDQIDLQSALDAKFSLSAWFSTTTHPAIAYLPALTIATGTDTNIVVNVATTSSKITITPSWTGTLADARITSASTWNAKESALTFSWPLSRSVDTISWAGLASTTNHVNGNLMYAIGANTYGMVATGTVSSSGGITTTANRGAVGGALAISCDVATGSVPGCLAAADFTTFNGKQAALVSGTNIKSINGVTILGSGDMAVASTTLLTNNNSFSGILTILGNLILKIAAAFTPTTEGEIGIDTTSNQVKYYSNSAVRVLGDGNFYPAFTYATTTAFTGTTTIPLGPAYTGETWGGVKCFTDTGTVNVSFNDGTNRMNLFNASTTVGTVVLSSNNTFTASEKRYVDIGTPASSPTKVSCTISKSLTAD